MDQVRTRHKLAPVASAGAIAELIAVIVAVTGGEPRVLTIDGGRALPSGPFEPTHRSLQAGTRSWVEQQTHHPLGYVEQLYTFADRDRTAAGQRTVSVSYLGLTREVRTSGEPGVGWQSWYRYFPWEDRRAHDAAELTDAIDARLHDWAEAAEGACGPTRPPAPHQHHLRPGRPHLERGTRPPALRTPVGSRPRP